MNNLRIFTFFFIAAIAGTLLHECGHALAAMWYGFHPEVHYKSCTTVSLEDWILIKAELLPYKSYPHVFWIIAGGPLQTILTGFIGLAGLLVLNRRTKIDAWNGKHLLWIVLAFFHSREIFNGVGILYKLYISGASSRSDEIKLMRYWDIPIETGTWTLLLLSSAILAYVTFGLVKKHRWQLILFGALGSFTGGFLWLYWLGELVLP